MSRLSLFLARTIADITVYRLCAITCATGFTRGAIVFRTNDISCFMRTFTIEPVTAREKKRENDSGSGKGDETLR